MSFIAKSDDLRILVPRKIVHKVWHLPFPVIRVAFEVRVICDEKTPTVRVFALKNIVTQTKELKQSA